MYQASVTSSEGTEHYVGHTDTDFKARFANHKQSLKTEKYSNQTELSKYVWRLKKAKTEYKIKKFGFINGVDNVNWPPYRDSKS